MGLNPGVLRHRVTIEYPRTVSNDYGEPEVTWYEWGERYARVSPLSGSERWAAQQTDATVSHEVEIRYAEDIRADMRVVHRGRNLHVNAVLDRDERRERLLLLCTEVAD